MPCETKNVHNVAMPSVLIHLTSVFYLTSFLFKIGIIDTNRRQLNIDGSKPVVLGDFYCPEDFACFSNFNQVNRLAEAECHPGTCSDFGAT